MARVIVMTCVALRTYVEDKCRNDVKRSTGLRLLESVFW